MEARVVARAVTSCGRAVPSTWTAAGDSSLHPLRAVEGDGHELRGVLGSPAMSEIAARGVLGQRRRGERHELGAARAGGSATGSPRVARRGRGSSGCRARAGRTPCAPSKRATTLAVGEQLRRRPAADVRGPLRMAAPPRERLAPSARRRTRAPGSTSPTPRLDLGPRARRQGQRRADAAAAVAHVRMDEDPPHAVELGDALVQLHVGEDAAGEDHVPQAGPSLIQWLAISHATASRTCWYAAATCSRGRRSARSWAYPGPCRSGSGSLLRCRGTLQQVRSENSAVSVGGEPDDLPLCCADWKPNALVTCA